MAGLKKLRLTDNSEMVLGKAYKGKKMIDIPPGHLLWWWENTDIQDKMRLGLYIEENYEVLVKQAANEDGKNHAR